MNKHTHGRVNSQIRRMRRQMLQGQDLCFGELLPKGQIEAAIERHQVRFRDRLYTPLLTLWTVLYQGLSADQSCRAAVSRLLAFLGVGEDCSGSAKTDPYCKARQRLPEKLIADLARQSGAELHRGVPATTLLHGRPIKLGDGTTLSMPDTAENQKAYPQPSSQQAGVGFPILRRVGLMSLSCGAVLDVAMGPYRGKQTGETALLRQLLGGLRAGDVLLADAYFANYWTIALLLQRGVDLLSHPDGKRLVDFRQGRPLGRQDPVVQWPKPPRPKWISRRLYRDLPETLSIRELRAQVSQRGFRTHQLLLVRTLLDGQQYSAQDLAAAYRARWNAELDLRSIKQVVQIDVLRCKIPSMVRKEVWMHRLAYNLVRKRMAQSAAQAGLCPRDIRFKGTLQTLAAFAAAGRCCPERHNDLYAAILRAVATHRVNNRPDRVEPRAVKRRPKKQVFLNEPRSLAIARLLKGR